MLTEYLRYYGKMNWSVCYLLM